MKVAMLHSLTKEPKLEIDIDSMQEAIEICEKFIGGVRHATLGKTDNDATNAVRKTILIQELMNRDNHAISRAQLNKKYWIQGNVNEWDEVCLSFEAAVMIKIEHAGNQMIFRMTDESVKE